MLTRKPLRSPVGAKRTSVLDTKTKPRQFPIRCVQICRKNILWIKFLQYRNSILISTKSYFVSAQVFSWPNGRNFRTPVSVSISLYIVRPKTDPFAFPSWLSVKCHLVKISVTKFYILMSLKGSTSPDVCESWIQL